MKFLEKDLEGIIFETLKTKDGYKTLQQIGLDLQRPSICLRQPRIGNYGIADLVTVDKWYFDGKPRLFIRVYELKKDLINLATVLQVSRYMTGIKHYLKHKGINNAMVVGRIIGKTVDTDDWVYLMSNVDNIDVYEYNYLIDGLKLEQTTFDYELINPNFK